MRLDAGLRKLKEGPHWWPILIGATILLFGLLSYKTVKLAVSETYLYLAVQEEARPAKTDAISREKKWIRVKLYLNQSLSYSPDNPRALDEAGRHDLVRTYSIAGVRQITLRSAADYFRQAVAQRPTWSNAWANLAIAKYELGIRDGEMHDALRHADELAPWDFDVQYYVLFINLDLWASLDAAQRAATVKAVERATRRDAASMAPLLQRAGPFDLMCDRGNGNPKVRELCSQLRNASAPGKSTER